MAAKETIPEAKQMEEHSESFIHKTTVLKVSIHCEGCKRKVKKILQGIYGVNDVNIDLRQQKVVVTGNVNSDILIRKLSSKTGKLVELWPEQPDFKKKQLKPEKQSHQECSESDQNDTKINQGDHNDNEKGKGKAKVVVDSSKNVQVTNNNSKNGDGCGGVNVNKPNEGCATGKIGTVQIQEPKPEVRQTVVLPAAPVLEKKVSVAVQFPNENEELANEKTISASNGGKKKKKKGKVSKNNGNEGASAPVEHCGDAPATGDLGSRSHGQVHVTNVHGQGHPGSVPVSRPSNESPPRHHVYQQYPPHYYAPPTPAPVCTVSYNTAYPSSSSYGAAYYAPPQPYSYAHVVQPGTEMEPRSPPYTYELESYAQSQPSDSFVFFSDENPNACSVM